LVVPAILFLTLASVTTQAFPRHAITALPALALLAAAGFQSLHHRWLPAAVAVSVGALVLPLQLALRTMPGEDAWAEKRQVLERNVRVGDLLLAQDHVYAMLPTADPVAGVKLVQDMGQLFVNAEPVVDFEADIRQSLQGADRVWLVRYDERPVNNDRRFTDWLSSEGLRRAAIYDGGNAPVDLWVRETTGDEASQ
jgi:hypothetical protein